MLGWLEKLLDRWLKPPEYSKRQAREEHQAASVEKGRMHEFDRGRAHYLTEREILESRQKILGQTEVKKQEVNQPQKPPTVKKEEIGAKKFKEETALDKIQKVTRSRDRASRSTKRTPKEKTTLEKLQEMSRSREEVQERRKTHEKEPPKRSMSISR